VVPLTDGGTLEKGETADIDRFAPEGLLPYKTLVLRRSPLASRPPLPFQLVEADDYYEVWQAAGTPAPLQHLGLEGAEGPSAVPGCEEVELFADLPGVRHLAAAVRPDPVRVPLGGLALPSDWEVGGEGAYVTPNSSGTAEGSFSVEESGDYGVWLGGSPRGDVGIEIDGEGVGSSGPELDHADSYREVGSVELEPGRHEIAFTYDEASPLAPGVGGEAFPLGPLLLSPTTAADARVEMVDPSKASSLCGRPLDWVEALPY
jgi:hypothetical protein